MAITIQHGGGLAGVASAYGAMGRAEVEAEAERKRKEEEKKGKRLGNIGSAMQIAGSVLTFTPLAPVGIGLTVAGSGLKQAAGGRGDQGMAVAGTAAAGISSIYAQQKLRQQEIAERMEYSKEMADYQNDLYTQRQKEYLDARSMVDMQKKLDAYNLFRQQESALQKAFDVGQITSEEFRRESISLQEKNKQVIEWDKLPPENVVTSSDLGKFGAIQADGKLIYKALADLEAKGSDRTDIEDLQYDELRKQASIIEEKSANYLEAYMSDEEQLEIVGEATAIVGPRPQKKNIWLSPGVVGPDEESYAKAMTSWIEMRRTLARKLANLRYGMSRLSYR